MRDLNSKLSSERAIIECKRNKCKSCGVIVDINNGYTSKQNGGIYLRRYCRKCYNNSKIYKGINILLIYRKCINKMTYLQKVMSYSSIVHYLAKNNMKIQDINEEIIIKKLREYNVKWLIIEENNKAYKEYKEAGGSLLKNHYIKRINRGDENIDRLLRTKPYKPINQKELEIYKDYLSFQKGGIYKTKTSYIEDKYGIKPKKIRNLVCRFFALKKAGHIQI